MPGSHGGQILMVLMASVCGAHFLMRYGDASKCAWGSQCMGLALGWAWGLMPALSSTDLNACGAHGALRAFQVTSHMGKYRGRHRLLLEGPTGQPEVLTAADSIPVGFRFLAWVRMEPPTGPKVTGGFDEAQWLAGKGVRYKWKADWVASMGRADGRTARWRQRMAGYRARVRTRCQRLGDQASAGLMLALTTGDRSAMSRKSRSAFSDLGLAHLTAVSGFHVGCVVAMFMGILSWVGWPRRRRFWLMIPGIWIYIALCGFPGSAVRAGIMATFVAAADGMSRRPDGFTLLSGAGLAMMAFSPHVVQDLGLCLSFSATAGILLWVRFLQRAEWTRNKQRLGLLLGVPVVATAFTSPWTWPAFGKFPTAFLLANALLTPTVPILVALSGVWVAFPALWMNRIAAWISLPFELLIQCVERMVGTWPAVVLPLDPFILRLAGLIWMIGTAMAMVGRRGLCWFLGGSLMAMALLRWQGFQESQEGVWYFGSDVVCVDRGITSVFTLPLSGKRKARKWETRTFLERVSHGTEAQVQWCGRRLAFSHCRLRYLHRDGDWTVVSSSPLHCESPVLHRLPKSPSP